MKLPLRIGVMADDLTGAGDVGGCFARAGFKTVISLPFGPDISPASRLAQIRQGDDPAEIHVLDTESRYEPPASAETRVAEAFWTLAALGTNFFYKKIDSTLRGNIGSEMEAFLTAFLAWKSNGIAGAGFPNPVPFPIAMIPAYPAAGRQTREGWQYVGGGPSGVHVPTLIQRTCPSWPFFQVEDCIGSADLKEAASHLLRNFSRTGFAACVASGGLADQIVKMLKPSSHGIAHFENAPRWPTLIVCGSRHPSSLTQVERFLDSSPRSVVIEGPGSSQVHWSDAVRSLSGARRPVVVVKTPQREARSTEVGEWLARTTRNILMALGPARLILMGGDTAFRVCEGLGVRRLEIQAMETPGVAVCEPVGSRKALAQKIVLKPGGFGSPSELIRILKN